MFLHTVPRERALDEAFKAPGRCIYCNETEGLTLEHIIPDGLYGNLVVPAASCHECLKEIKKYETPVILHQFGMARMAMGIHSKKRRGRGYRRASTYRTTSTSDETQRERPANAAMPHAIQVGHFSRRPAILTGNMPGENEGAASLSAANLVGEKDIVSSGPFRINDTVKFMAKVAHGYAAGCLGIDEFTPYLRSLIRNEEDAMAPWYVGINGQGSDDAAHLHQLSLEIGMHSCSRYPQLPVSPRSLVIVSIDMFLGYNLPTYEVVVGEVSPSANSTV